MRGIFAASFFAVVLVLFASFFAWKTTRIQKGYDPNHMVVDSGELARQEELMAERSRSDIPKWLDAMSMLTDRPSLPADESEVGIDLVNPSFRDNILLFLRVDSPDRFQKLCLEHYFKSREINFTISDGEFYDIALGIKDPGVAAEMIEELATYDLAAELITRKEPKPY